MENSKNNLKTRTSNLGLIGKIILWGVGTLGTLGIVSGCGNEYVPPQQTYIKPNVCANVRCDAINCYSDVDNSFCITRNQLIENWNKNVFKTSYKNNPNYFITTTPDSSWLPEVKENFRIFRIYAIAKLGGVSCSGDDCSYRGEKLCSRSDFEDVVSNIYTERFMKNETTDIENWYMSWNGFPKVQERIRLLEAEWVKKQQFAQLRRQQNPTPTNQVIVQQAQPDLALGALGVLFQGFGSDVAFYEYAKRN